jgi:hypothetical protein
LFSVLAIGDCSAHEVLPILKFYSKKQFLEGMAKVLVKGSQPAQTRLIKIRNNVFNWCKNFVKTEDERLIDVFCAKLTCKSALGLTRRLKHVLLEGKLRIFTLFLKDLYTFRWV